MSLISAEEMHLLANDSKYKSYASSMDKALKNFESSTEWADLISSLGKLKKCLQSYPKYAHIPKRISVCKRLAQCLHPALPSGVHLKALEVYTVLFQNIGADTLSRDLFLYSSGLFPLLANAALSVKPVLLTIYETHFLPLRQALRPCLTGILLGLLPGLEEGSDFYARTFTLLRHICLAQSTLDTAADAANDRYFYTCLWSAIVAQSSIRFPAIQFILTNYENQQRQRQQQRQLQQDDNEEEAAAAAAAAKKRDDEEQKEEDEHQLYIMGNSAELMINGMCCCLQDSNSLVQRSVLDLMCACVPLSTRAITRHHKLQLIVVAVHVVLRRDMSLNRRIYSWLMGSAGMAAVAAAAQQQQQQQQQQQKQAGAQASDIDVMESSRRREQERHYFAVHSKQLLVHAIKMLLNQREAILYLIGEEPASASSASSSLAGSRQQLSNIGGGSTLSPVASTSSTLKILKIVSNLVERQEIGQAIIDDILLDLLFYVYKETNALAAAVNASAAPAAVVGGGAHLIMMMIKKQQQQQQQQLQQQQMGTSGGGGGGGNSGVNHHSHHHQQQVQQQQCAKELTELRKATCNFLFQSFQLYFIWHFCAIKFELVCKRSVLVQQQTATENDTQSTHNQPLDDDEQQQQQQIISPAQLCDLYEFILDLLTNAVSLVQIDSCCLFRFP